MTKPGEHLTTTQRGEELANNIALLIPKLQARKEEELISLGGEWRLSGSHWLVKLNQQLNRILFPSESVSRLPNELQSTEKLLPILAVREFTTDHYGFIKLERVVLALLEV